MLGELLVIAALAVLAGLLIAILVARFLYRGPCPRCGAAIRRGDLDCLSCGCCVGGSARPLP